MRNGKERRGRMHEHHLSVSRTARYFTLGERSAAVAEVWFACHGYGQLAARFLEKLRVLDDGTRYLVAPLRAARVSLVYGRADQLITEKVIRQIADRLRAHAIPYREIPFDGGHELNDGVLRGLGGETAS